MSRNPTYGLPSAATRCRTGTEVQPVEVELDAVLDERLPVRGGGARVVGPAVGMAIFGPTGMKDWCPPTRGFPSGPVTRE